MTWKNGVLLSCVLGVSMMFLGCAEECVETDDGGYCVDYYGYGYYYDSLVSGVTYENVDQVDGEDQVVRTSVTGEGGDPGVFRYREGGTVRFSLGDTVLGEVSGQQRVTPFDLTGIDEEAVGGCDVSELPGDEDPFRQVAHLAVLLQTLDEDGDPAEGIEISSEVAAHFDGVELEIDQVWADFQDDLQAVLDQIQGDGLLPNANVLEREEALAALYRGIGLCE